jgi:hypothetical protein
MDADVVIRPDLPARLRKSKLAYAAKVTVILAALALPRGQSMPLS